MLDPGGVRGTHHSLCYGPVSHMQAFPEGGLAYFNHGPLSGMSMPHKHLQVIPLPLGSAEPGTLVPTGALLDAAVAGADVGAVREVRKLPCRAYACRIDDTCASAPLRHAQRSYLTRML